MKRCPKCGSKALVFYEIATMSLPLEQTEQGNWRRVYSSPEPYVHAVDGRCRDCRHEWHSRMSVLSDGRRYGSDENLRDDPTIMQKAT